MAFVPTVSHSIRWLELPHPGLVQDTEAVLPEHWQATDTVGIVMPLTFGAAAVAAALMPVVSWAVVVVWHPYSAPALAAEETSVLK